MTSPPDPIPDPPSQSDLADGEVVAVATGILMVRYQLTHDQARTALAERARRARLDARAEAEQVIASQDTSIRRWASGPAAGAFDRSRFERHGTDPSPTHHPAPREAHQPPARSRSTSDVLDHLIDEHRAMTGDEPCDTVA